MSKYFNCQRLFKSHSKKILSVFHQASWFDHHFPYYSLKRIFIPDSWSVRTLDCWLFFDKDNTFYMKSSFVNVTWKCEELIINWGHGVSEYETKNNKKKIWQKYRNFHFYFDLRIQFLGTKELSYILKSQKYFYIWSFQLLIHFLVIQI